MPVKVLLVHPRGPLADSLQALLTEASIHAEVEHDPEAGLERLVRGVYQVGVVAADLPEAGPTLIREAQERGCRIPLLVLADAEDPELDRAAQAAGAAGFLSRDALTAQRLGSALRYARTAYRSGELRSGDLLERLARNLVHDGKNALAGLRSGMQVLGASVPPGSPEAEIHGEIQGRLSALHERLEELTLLTRPLRPVRARIRVDALLADAARTAQEAGSAPIEIDPTQVELEADARLLRQALVAILRNAVEALTESGKLDEPVRVSARASGGDCVLEVCDGGPGLPLDVDEALLPFATTKSRAAGLGLPLALRIARAHGGDLKLRPEPGGVTVELRLPLA